MPFDLQVDTDACTHIHTEQVKLTVIYQSVKFSFIDPVKGVGFINYSNAALWLGVAAATQTFSDVISLCIFFPPSSRMWLNPVSLSDSITLLLRLPSHAAAHAY